ncbi:MAG: hypothetical protein RL291_1099 [Pseudomonadota bacterium]
MTTASGTVPKSPQPVQGTPQSLAASIIAGLVVGFIAVAEALAEALLLFASGPAEGVPYAFFAMLIGLVVGSLLLAQRYSLPPNAGGPDSSTIAVMSLLPAQFVAVIAAGGGSTAQHVPTILAAFSLVTMISGLALLMLGLYGAGAVVRFVPTPVIAGFVGGAGVLVLLGAYRIALGESFSLQSLKRVADPASWSEPTVVRLGAAVAFAIALRLLLRWTKNPFAMPLLFLAACMLVHVLVASYAPNAQATWFVRDAGEPDPWLLFNANIWSNINWPALWSLAPEILSTAAIMIVSILGKTAGHETIDGKSADLDRDMRTVGAINTGGAAFAMLPTMMWGPTLRTLMKSAGGSHISAYVVAASALLPILGGAKLIQLLPLPVLAGFLLYGGYVVLHSALARFVKHRQWNDLLLALTVLAVAVTLGYVAAVIVGMILACLMFTVRYSRVPSVKRHLTRRDVAGSVDYDPKLKQAFATDASSCHLFWLSGYVFFGSSDRLFAAVRTAVETAGNRPLKAAVIDMSEVTGIDTAGLLGLAKLKLLADRRGIALYFTGAPADIAENLKLEGIVSAKGPHRHFNFRPEALAAADALILPDLQAKAYPEGREAFPQWLARELGSADRATRLMAAMSRRSFAAGTRLYRQGDAAGTIDFIESGTLKVSLAGPSDDTSRPIRFMQRHTIVGDMGFIRRTPRSAHIETDGEATVQTLTREAFEALERDDPELSMALMALLIRTLADRLDLANDEYAALL